MVDDIIHRSQSPVRNFNNHKSQGEGVIYCLEFECPNLPCGEEAKRKHDPSSKLQKILIGRTIFGGDSWCREDRSFLCYFCFVVVYYCVVVGINIAVVFVFVHVFVLVDLVIFRCRIGTSVDVMERVVV